MNLVYKHVNCKDVAIYTLYKRYEDDLVVEWKVLWITLPKLNESRVLGADIVTIKKVDIANWEVVDISKKV